MKRYWPMLLPPSALLSQALSGLLVRLMPGFVYGDNPLVPERWLWFISTSGLMMGAVCGMVLGVVASYLLLTRFHVVPAGIMIALFCIPAWLLSVFFLQAALVFLAWI